MNMKNRRYRGILLMLVFLLVFRTGGAAQASGEWLMLSGEDAVPEQGFLVQEYTGTVRITFLGDCTLGCEEKTRTAGRGFPKTIEEYILNNEL